MKATLEVEASFGRVRSVANAARTLDLDVIACEDLVCDLQASDDLPAIELPHPRMHDRAFVLLPLAEIEPTWRHPVLNQDISVLVDALPPQNIRIMGSGSKDRDNSLAKS